MSNLVDLTEKFNQSSIKNQLLLIEQIEEQGEAGEQFLREFLVSESQLKSNIVIGKIYQRLSNSKNQINEKFLTDKFPEGIIPLKSEKNISYRDLQELLIKKDYQSADALTRVKLCQLVGEKAVQRKWIYFTEVNQCPVIDLGTIDLLWQIYSEGKFGYSIQRKIWLFLGKNYEELWIKLSWKKGNKWTKYPQEFIWDLTAPLGHLPLSNQLRGVREIDALFAHPAWSQE